MLARVYPRSEVPCLAIFFGFCEPETAQGFEQGPMSLGNGMKIGGLGPRKYWWPVRADQLFALARPSSPSDPTERTG